MKLVTAAEMRDLDRRAGEEYAVPSLLLMENAGRAVAHRALAMLPPGGAVAVYCGTGNNGGDGFVAARHLANAGCRVRLFLAADGKEPRGDAAANREIVRRLRLPVRELATSSARREAWRPDLVIDAVLGTGLHGEVSGGAAVLIRAIHAAEAPVLAVDLPSGLESDSGRLAELSVAATRTVTFALPKLGMALYPGRQAAGEVEVADISIPHALLDDARLRTEWLDAAWTARVLPPRPPAAHKGDAGRVFVLAGSEGMVGAAALSSFAAVRGGAGLVTLGCPRSLIDVLAGKLTEVMTFPLPETDSRAPDLAALDALRDRAASADALAIGPGLGRHPRTGDLLRAFVHDCRCPLVLDADALNLLAGAERFPPQAVLTPHPGELARLTGATIAAIEADRVAAARNAARRFGCVVLLKGAATLVAAPDGRLAVNSTGTPAMATGGVGDVLTGLVAALLGQGLAPYEATCAAAYLHGLAGEIAAREIGGIGIAAGDLLERIPAARGEVSSQRNPARQPPVC